MIGYRSNSKKTSFNLYDFFPSVNKNILTPIKATAANVNITEQVLIGKEITDCSYLFQSQMYFNQPVTIPNSVTNCANMFLFCHNFNQPIIIPNSVTDCNSMFFYCNNFNQPVIIPNSVTNCSSMFFYCNNFNQPIIIPNSVTDCSGMFRSCHLNNNSQLLTQNFFNAIGEKCTNAAGMFESSRINGSPSGLFSYYIWFKELIDGRNLFSRCPNVDLSSLGIIFNRSISMLYGAFSNVTIPPRNIWIRGKNINNIYKMLNGKNNSYRVNIWFDGAKTALFRNSSSAGSLVGTSISWSTMTNGYYNARYNIYLYNNYNSFS